MSDGDTITAALFNNEYNQLVNAFAYSSSAAGSTGHRHDGTAGHGGNIHTIGDLDFLNKIAVSGNTWGVFVEVSSAAVEQIRIQDGAIVPVTDNDIDLGTSSLEFKDAYFDGTVTSDAFAGPLTGNVTGNASGTAATVTTAAQSNITSLGTLTTLTVDNVIINGTTIGHTSDTDLLTLTSGVLTVAGELDATSLDISGDADIDGTLETDALSINGTTVSATAAELNTLDGVTAVVGELNALDIGVTAIGTAVASKAVILDANKDERPSIQTIPKHIIMTTPDKSIIPEKVYTTHYFIRLKNGEYNFSNNPTFTSGSQGQFAHPSMYKDPKVYITTVGMYNDSNELLAIAKLSKPLLKSFTREALIRVKLEF